MSVDAAQRSNAVVAAEAAPLFVINLCASTSPMALTHPDSPDLKRYTFFVSRQREDGRERFRLHMGYFGSQQEAESLLGAVRDVYPAAWAGPAPTSGVPKRARMTVAPSVTVKPSAPSSVALPASAPAPQNPAPPTKEALETLSNVRNVLAQLSEEVSLAPAKDLSDSQTLRVLETAMPAPTITAPAPPRAMPAAPRVAAKAPPALAPASSDAEVRIVTPEDTQTLTDIKLDAQNNAPPCFSVQLVWAVAPIDVSTLPHLAIFDAYTLYNVEGSRQGRKWFGLRLGFFSDPNSATQVAHYVRADYPTVAVVPVATRERDHAIGGAPAAQRIGPSTATQRPETNLTIEKQALNGFELLPDNAPRAEKRDIEVVTPPPAAVSTTSAMTAREKIAAAAAGKPQAKATGKRVVVRKQTQTNGRVAPGAPNPLESTLEILGASTLTLDESREIVNDSAIRKPIERKSGSRFSKLLNRLSGG